MDGKASFDGRHQQQHQQQPHNQRGQQELYHEHQNPPPLSRRRSASHPGLWSMATPGCQEGGGASGGADLTHLSMGPPPATAATAAAGMAYSHSSSHLPSTASPAVGFQQQQQQRQPLAFDALSGLSGGGQGNVHPSNPQHPSHFFPHASSAGGAKASAAQRDDPFAMRRVSSTTSMAVGGGAQHQQHLGPQQFTQPHGPYSGFATPATASGAPPGAAGGGVGWGVAGMTANEPSVRRISSSASMSVSGAAGGGGGYYGGGGGALASTSDAGGGVGGGIHTHAVLPFHRSSSGAHHSHTTPITTGQFSLPELHSGMSRGGVGGLGVGGGGIPDRGLLQPHAGHGVQPGLNGWQAGTVGGTAGGGDLPPPFGYRRASTTTAADAATACAGADDCVAAGGEAQQQQMSSVSSMDTSSYAPSDTRPIPLTAQFPSLQQQHYPMAFSSARMGLPEGLPPSLFRSSSAAHFASAPSNSPFRMSPGAAAAAGGSSVAGSPAGMSPRLAGIRTGPASSVGGVSGEEVWVHTVVEGNHVLVTTQPLPSIPDLITIHLPPHRKQQQHQGVGGRPSSGGAGGAIDAGGGRGSISGPSGGGGGEGSTTCGAPSLRQYGSCSSGSLRICIEELHQKLERCGLGGLHQGA